MPLYQIFYELIRVALGNAVCLSHTPNTDEWGMLYAMAKKQSLVGICFAGVQKLQAQQQCPPEMLYLQWMGMTAKIQQRNEVVNRQTTEVYSRLVADESKACVLKGQAMNALYVSLKGLRQSGDIDIWMMDEPRKVIDWARNTGKMHYYDYHHADISIFNDTEVEVHYRPSISRNLIRNSRLQEWLQTEGVKHVCYDEALGFAVPDYTFNVILTLNHNFWHLMYEGVGMRQFLDLYFVLRSKNENTSKGSAQADDENLLNLLKRLKLLRFVSACMWVMKEVFRLEDEYLICKPEETRGKALLAEIMLASNFGHHDERLNDNRYKTSRLGLMLAWMKHNLRFFWQYTEDVFWTPIGILRISLWRHWHYRNEMDLKNK